MCLALPGRIKKKEGMKLIVEYPNESREALNGGISVEAGDYVLVQMGVVVKKLSSEEAEVALGAWK